MGVDEHIIRRIAIDPGHVGGRLLDLRRVSLDGVDFREGDFCYAWAEILNRKLTAKGFEVLMTRTLAQPSRILTAVEIAARRSALDREMSIEAALKKFRVPRKFFPEKTDSDLLAAAIQNEGDLINRAKMVNEFRADLCISLHLNGDPTQSFTHQNGICGFTTEKSLTLFPLMEKIVNAVLRATQLQSLPKWAELKPVAKGVFLDETLTLLKNLNCPVLLLEGPFQNNVTELKTLIDSLSTWIRKKRAEGRLAELSDAIAEALP